jgi:hypothetical protein
MATGADLEWIFIDENNPWPKPGVKAPRPNNRRRRSIVWVTLILIVLVSATVLFLRHRVAQSQRQLRAEIQALIDLEARAIANGDRELYLSLKSGEDDTWFEWQQYTFDYLTQNPDAWPHLRITDVEVVDEYAWVRAVGTSKENDNPFDWVLFYRWTKDAWRHAPPDLRYWGPEREQDNGHLHFVYRDRDEPFVEPTAAELNKLLRSLCDDLSCQADLQLMVHLALPYPYGRPPPSAPNVIVLPSPAALPQPTGDLSTMLSASVQSEDLAHYIAFEAAGGEKRWESTPHGAWLVHAAANWAHERLAQRSERPSWQFYTGQGQELLRYAVRNGRKPSLDDVWHKSYFASLPYPSMVQYVSRYIDLDGAKARAFIDYIIETYGKEAIPRLLGAIGRHDTLEAALQEALGISQITLDPIWLAWLEIHYGFGRGWRLAEAVAYWEDTQNIPTDTAPQGDAGVGQRQYQELMRIAVQGNRVLPVMAIWNGSGSERSTGRESTYSITTVSKPDSSFEHPLLLSSTRTFAGSEAPTDIPRLAVGHPRNWRSAHALAVIRYVAGTFGKEAVQRLLPAIVRNETLDGALRDALGVGLDEFEPGWRAWLEAHYGEKGPGPSGRG